MAHLQLTEKTNREHLDAGKDEHAGDHEHGTVVVHDVRVRVQDLQPQQHGGDDAARQNSERAEAAEEVQRAAHVLQQESNREQIKEHAEGAADAVVAPALLAHYVADGNLANRRAVPAGQRGDEAVHLAVEGNVLDHFAAIGLERGAEVVDVDAGEFGHQPVGAARGKAAHDKVVDALLAPAGNHVVALFEFLEEVGDLVGVVLQVAVHGEDVLAGGMIEAGGQCRSLSEVAAQLDDENPAVHRRDLFEKLVGAVAGAVVYQDQLKSLAYLLHDLFEARVEVGDVLFFVMEGNNNGKLRHTNIIDAVLLEK